MLEGAPLGNEGNFMRLPTKNRAARHYWKSRRVILTFQVMLVTTWFLAAPAWASTFDEDTGRLDLSDAAFALSLDSLDDLPSSLGFWVTDVDFSFLPQSDLEELFEEDPEGLEGAGALSFGGEAVYMQMELNSLPSDLAGRRVEIRIWQRPLGTKASLDVSWIAGGGGWGHYLGSVSLSPTGRSTDDGWEEWSTGPIDFAAGGVFGPANLTVYDAQLLQMYSSYFLRFDEDARVLLDGFEVIDLGPAAVPESVCTALDERERCSTEGLCLFGRCVDGALVAGPLPSAQAGIREDYVARRAFEYRTFEGGRVPQAQMANLEAAFDGLRGSTSASEFWPTFREAVEQLQDGHSSAPYMSYGTSAAIGVCAHLGEADLLPGGEGILLPMVFSVVGNDPLATSLQEGDVLVDIDGLSPEVWSEAAPRLLGFSGDPEAFAVSTAPDLLEAATLSGSTVTFERCIPASLEDGPCAEDDVERITFDMAELAGEPLWEGSAPSWLTSEPPYCDFRFRRAFDGPEVFNGDFAGVVDEDGVRTLLINGVPSYWDEGGEAWFDAAADACIPPPEMMILDQRLGGGGAIGTTDYLSAMLIAEEDFYGMSILPLFDRPFDDDLRDTLDACFEEWGQECGDAWHWVLGESSERPPMRGYAADTRLAILISLDVSGNDFTTQLLSYRSGPTRIFGPSPTWGAFGPVYMLPSHLGELMGGSLQHHDTLFMTSTDDRNTEFHTGHGVPPDQLVFQRQSDAVAGVDTIIEAARTWLTEEGE